MPSLAGTAYSLVRGPGLGALTISMLAIAVVAIWRWRGIREALAMVAVAYRPAGPGKAPAAPGPEPAAITEWVPPVPGDGRSDVP